MMTTQTKSHAVETDAKAVVDARQSAQNLRQKLVQVQDYIDELVTDAQSSASSNAVSTSSATSAEPVRSLSLVTPAVRADIRESALSAVGELLFLINLCHQHDQTDMRRRRDARDTAQHAAAPAVERARKAKETLNDHKAEITKLQRILEQRDLDKAESDRVQSEIATADAELDARINKMDRVKRKIEQVDAAIDKRRRRKSMI